VAATLRFDSGAIGSLVSIWHDLLERPSLRRIEVFCERAYFWLDDDVLGPVHWTRPDGREGSTTGTARRNPDAAFIEAAQAGQPATPDFADALRAHVVADALYRSAASGGSMLDVTPGP
jgi:predicted dehydrogenase